MAVIETWLHQDADSLVEVVPLKGNLFYGDNEGNLIGVEVTRAGAAVSLPSGCYGFVLRSDGSTEYVQGTVSGNKAWIILPTGCYAKVGPIGIVIKTGATMQGNKAIGGVTLAACTGYIYKTHTDTIVDPGSVLPDIGQLQQAIANCIAATNSAENVNVSQSKSGNTITVTTTNRNGQSTNKTLTEPTVSVTKHGTTDPVPAREGDFDITVIGPNASGNIVTHTVTIPNPNAELSDRAHVNTVSRLKTRTGNPIQIEDAVNEIADKTVIKLVPKQDLHGYSRPWVGGAGKNLANFENGYGLNTSGAVVTNAQRIATRNPIPITQNQSYVLSFASGLGAGYAVYNGSTYVRRVTSVTSGTEININDGDNIYINVFRGGESSSTAPVTVDEAKAQFEKGSTATAYEPFENLCPISGYDTVKAVVNLFDYRKMFSESKSLQASVMTYELAVPNGVYTLSTNVPKASGNYAIFMTLANNSASSSYNGVGPNEPRTLTVENGKLWIHYRVGGSGTIVSKEDFDNGTYWVVLRKGTEAGTIYPIAVSLATNGNQTAGTVYSGTVTLLADGSGQLTIDKKKRAFTGSDVADRTSENTFRLADLSDAVAPSSRGINSEGVCSLYVVPTDVNASEFRAMDGAITYSHRNISPTTGRVAVHDVRYDTVEDYAAFLNAMNTAGTPLELVYKLATPLTYTLTANQVQTLLGYNYIYTDGAEIALTYRQESLATNETLLKLLPTGSASGNPVTFSDGADGVPLKQLVVNVQPNQDLHGYGKPWVAGAGKNKVVLDADEMRSRYSSWNSEDSVFISGITYTLKRDDDGNIIGINANGTATADASLFVTVNVEGDYKFIGCPSGGSASKYNVYMWDGTANARPKKWDGTTGSENDIDGSAFKEVKFASGHTTYIVCRVMSGQTVSNILFKPMVCVSTETDTTFAPYTNFCPIWGWDEVPLYRWNGKNLYCKELVKTTNNLRIDENGVEAASDFYGTSDFFNMFGSKQLTFSAQTTNSGGAIIVVEYSESKSFLARTALTTRTGNTLYGTLTTNPNTKYMRISLPKTTSAEVAKFDTLQIEPGSTMTAYEQYGKVYDISIPSEAGTVYGCQIVLDENGEGDLVVDSAYAIVDKSDNIIRNGDRVFTIPETALPGILHQFTAEGLYCDKLLCATGNIQDNRAYVDDTTTGLRVRTSGYYATSALMLESFGGSIGFVYPLATPITYSLTADQVKTLLGTNIISSDAGNVEVEYFKKLSDKGTGEYSHVEGRSTVASGLASHAEGDATEATGTSAHSEGYSTHATGNNSHAEGMNSTASGEDAHAEGFLTTASGDFSHVEGSTATASGQSSHAEGKGTTANHLAQHVFGIFNAADPSTAAATAKGNYVEIVGNGTSVSAKHNARTLDWNGNEWLAGSLTLGNTTLTEAKLAELVSISSATGVTF